MQEEFRESWGQIRGERHHGSGEVERLILLFNLWRYGGPYLCRLLPLCSASASRLSDITQA